MRPSRIIGLQYFLYFGVLGIFLPYFNLYCHHIGFTGFQIGLISALKTGLTVLFPLCWGILADRLGARRPIYVACNLASTFIWLLFLFTTDFRVMLIITAVYAIFHAPVISFLEAFTMDILGKGKHGYGKVRVWGSLSFTAMVLTAGSAIDFSGVSIILPLIFAGSLALSFMSFKVPEASGGSQKSVAASGRPPWDRRVAVFLVSAFLMLLSHGTYYGFFSIHLEQMAFGKTFTGIAWALASVTEMLVMVGSARLFKRFSLEKVLFFSFMIAALRWTALSWARSPAVILLSQTLHAVTYGAFHISSILYIDRVTPGRFKTFGQAVNSAATYGLGTMIGFFLNGYLFETLGAPRLFLFSGFIAFAGGMLFLSGQSGQAGQKGLETGDSW